MSRTAFVLFTLCAAQCAQAAESITVYGSRTPEYATTTKFADSAQFVSAAPGASVRRNGALTGVPQYRGMHTYRVRTQVDGRQPHTAGPVWMDSPLHYLPSSLVDSLEVYRGIAPVRAGSAIGGYVEAHSLASYFTSEERYHAHSRVTLDGHDVDDGANASVFWQTANRHNRFHFFGVHDEADNYDSGDRTVLGTEYERDYAGFGAGHRSGGHEWSFSYARNNTGDAGTPALPMDIAYYHTDLVNSHYQTTQGPWKVEAQLHYQKTDHWMSNYHLRDTPNFSMAPLPPFLEDDRRHVQVDGEAYGGKLHLLRAAGGGVLLLGIDANSAKTSALIGDPDFAAFFVDNYKNATAENLGVFAEWDGPLSDMLRGSFGARIQHSRTDSDRVTHFRPPGCTGGMGPCPGPAMAVGRLSAAFNNADRSQNDTEIDLVAVLERRISDTLEVEVGVARKTRAPAYMERYLWVPLESNSGLGDGNNYVGNIDLKPETSWQLELGARWEPASLELTPRVFYRQVDDYITGIPEPAGDARTVSTALNGDPTPARFANVDAEFYGADMGFRMPLSLHWTLRGNVSYVRGKLRETVMNFAGEPVRDDNIDRLPPLRGMIAFEREADDWAVTFETEWADRQDKLSAVLTDDANSVRNSFDPVSGYALFHLRARYDLPAHDLRLLFGVENLTDREYADATNGFNRVCARNASHACVDAPVAIGERLPGAGRNVFLRLVWNSGH